MKRTLKLFATMLIVASMALSVVACTGSDSKLAQGIDAENHVINVGNTAATTGAFASVGGHFGTNTVGATVDYIQEQGIPMVYGVCGVSNLYNTEKNIMTVQPIYDTEGQSMVATAFAPVANGGLAATKLGVISTTDDAGKGMLNGIKIEVAKLGKGAAVSYQEAAADATSYAAQVTALKDAGCDVVIIAANQAPFVNIANAFVTANYENVKLLTSYVSANAATMGGLVLSGAISATREVYAGAWLVTGSLPDPTFKGWNDFVEYVKVVTMYDKSKGTELLATYPMTGYNADGKATYFPGDVKTGNGVDYHMLACRFQVAF